MIINEKGLAKALKQAGKHGGYTILNSGGEVTIYTEGWYLRADWDKFPRKALAAIVEHMGTLPTTADALNIVEGEEPQTAMPEMVADEIAERVRWNVEERAAIVPVMVRGLQLYQVEENGKCYGVDPDSLKIVERDIATCKEAIVADGNRLVWEHDGELVVVVADRPVGAYWAMKSEKDVWSALESVDLHFREE